MENKDLRIEMKGKGHRATMWRPVSLEDFLSDIKVTREVIAETMSDTDVEQFLPQYTDDIVLDGIRAGKDIDTPCLIYRLANGDNCPRCGHKFDPDFPALSRKDNKTHICGLCGIREAIESIPRSHQGDAR